MMPSWIWKSTFNACSLSSEVSRLHQYSRCSWSPNHGEALGYCDWKLAKSPNGSFPTFGCIVANTAIVTNVIVTDINVTNNISFHSQSFFRFITPNYHHFSCEFFCVIEMKNYWCIQTNYVQQLSEYEELVMPSPAAHTVFNPHISTDGLMFRRLLRMSYL